MDLLFTLGVIIAVAAAVAFAALGGLTLWGGLNTLTSELPRGFVRSGVSGAGRLGTLALVGLPLLITGAFGLLAALRILQVAFGLG